MAKPLLELVKSLLSFILGFDFFKMPFLFKTGMGVHGGSCLSVIDSAGHAELVVNDTNSRT